MANHRSTSHSASSDAAILRDGTQFKVIALMHCSESSIVADFMHRAEHLIQNVPILRSTQNWANFVLCFRVLLCPGSSLLSADTKLPSLNAQHVR